METRKNEIERDYSVEMQEAFYAEELEERLELAAAFPNLACWITDL
jgi:2-oxo-4-hydroxy-4-carboxy--5-ureidoimidazoline (OHCU) decarboxylase